MVRVQYRSAREIKLFEVGFTYYKTFIICAVPQRQHLKSFINAELFLYVG